LRKYDWSTKEEVRDGWCILKLITRKCVNWDVLSV